MTQQVNHKVFLSEQSSALSDDHLHVFLSLFFFHEIYFLSQDIDNFEDLLMLFSYIVQERIGLRDFQELVVKPNFCNE